MMVVLLALLASLANAVSSICQRLGVEDATQKNGPSMSLVRHMVQRKIWLFGFAIMAGGYGLQATALHLGSLNLVQPLMVSEMVILVVILWLWYFPATPEGSGGRRRHGPRSRRFSRRGQPLGGDACAE